MVTLRQNWWKLIIIVLITLITRVLLLQLLPLKTSSTFELAPSNLSQSIGLIPTAAIVITTSYTVIASVLIIIQETLYGSKLRRWFLCSVPFSFIWFMGVLESVSSLGKPILPELLIGLSDIVPILIMGGIISVWFSSVGQQNKNTADKSSVFGSFIIASTYFIGRYFLYTLIRINSGYFLHEIATFLWTLAMGLAIGLAYCLLRDGVKGHSPLSRGLWFGFVAFGLYWTLNNFFMPIVFDMSFIRFSPTIMNYVYRVVIDIVFVSFGVWIFDNSYSP
jgi:hypothetical protein